MNEAEAREWLDGAMSSWNQHATDTVATAQEDAAMAQHAYWYLRANRDGLLENVPANAVGAAARVLVDRDICGVGGGIKDEDVRDALAAAYPLLTACVRELEAAIREHSCGIGIGCWCPGASDGDEHDPGCRGIRPSEREVELHAHLLADPQVASATDARTGGGN